MKGIIQTILKASLLCALVLSFSFSSLAQKAAVQTNNDEDSYNPIIATLDSLVSSHYLQKVSESSETGFPESEFNGTEIPVYDNDIYAKRIQKIQTDIPLTFNAEVKEYLDLYALKRRSLTPRVMGLSGLYFPMFEQILDEQGLPLEFKYLSIVESALNPTAVSRMGATGLWQFMLPTGRMYNLKVNTLIDERRDPVKATYAACAHIKDLYRQFGSWTLAAAAYNGGGERISRELKAQKVDNFYDLYLNSETSKYVFRILAIKAILNDPQKYGFDLDNKNLYKPLQNIHQIQIDTSINDLPAFARSQGTTYRMLRYLNPWLIDRSLPVKGKSYTLNIPDK